MFCLLPDWFPAGWSFPDLGDGELGLSRSIFESVGRFGSRLLLGGLADFCGFFFEGVFFFLLDGAKSSLGSSAFCFLFVFAFEVERMTISSLSVVVSGSGLVS